MYNACKIIAEIGCNHKGDLGIAKDLIYCVSILGVTGNFNSANHDIAKYMKRVKENSECPFVVGFGIKNNKD